MKHFATQPTRAYRISCCSSCVITNKATKFTDIVFSRLLPVAQSVHHNARINSAHYWEYIIKEKNIRTPMYFLIEWNAENLRSAHNSHTCARTRSLPARRIRLGYIVGVRNCVCKKKRSIFRGKVKTWAFRTEISIVQCFSPRSGSRSTKIAPFAL